MKLKGYCRYNFILIWTIQIKSNAAALYGLCIRLHSVCHGFSCVALDLNNLNKISFLLYSFNNIRNFYFIFLTSPILLITEMLRHLMKTFCSFIFLYYSYIFFQAF